MNRCRSRLGDKLTDFGVPFEKRRKDDRIRRRIRENSRHQPHRKLACHLCSIVRFRTMLVGVLKPGPRTRTIHMPESQNDPARLTG